MYSVVTRVNDIAVHTIAPFRKASKILSNLAGYKARQRATDGSHYEWVGKLISDGYAHALYDQASMAELIDAATTIHQSTSIMPRESGKKFFRQLLDDDILKANPVFMEFALDPVICGGLVNALGAVPYLESVELILSLPETGSLSQSQYFHYDYVDTWAVKQFIYIYDVNAEEGPFTLLPRKVSASIPYALPHYVSDEVMSKYCNLNDVVELMGPAGSRLMIDVRNCYHFGSRSSRPRLAFVAYYNTGYGYYPRCRTWKGSFAEKLNLDSLQRQILDL